VSHYIPPWDDKKNGHYVPPPPLVESLREWYFPQLSMGKEEIDTYFFPPHTQVTLEEVKRCALPLPPFRGTSFLKGRGLRDFCLPLLRRRVCHFGGRVIEFSSSYAWKDGSLSGRRCFSLFRRTRGGMVTVFLFSFSPPPPSPPSLWRGLK